MRKTTGLLGLLAAILLLPSVGFAQQTIRWEPTLENAQRLAGQSNRLVLIQFWAPWCGYCKRMEVEVLAQPPVAAAIAANYVAVKINADNLRSIAQQYGISGLPTTVITTPQGQLLDMMQGRVEAAEAVKFAARLSQVAAVARQRSGVVYAPTPARSASPATVAQSPTMGGPSLAVPAQTPPADNPSMASDPGQSDDRYADFFRRGKTSPVAPIAQPARAAPAQAFPPSQPMLPASQPPALAPAAPPYGSRSPLPSPQQPLNQPASNPGLPSPAGGLTPRIPAINPPLGLNGYCPISLVEKQQWALGDRRWGAIHRGRTYLFSGPEEQRRFFTDPDRFAPVISGNDVVLATEQGQPVPGMREHGVFYDTRVYLFSSEATLEKFERHPTHYANQVLGVVRTGAYAGQALQ